MKKFKLYRTVAALALVGTMTTGVLTGCGNNNKPSLLDGTILEETRVISFDDGHKDIATIEDVSCNASGCNCSEKMYKSIVTDEYFSNDRCEASLFFKGVDLSGVILNHYSFIDDESIVVYLTTDEIVKASKGELTEDDISNIINRIFAKEDQNSVQKVK